MEVTAEGIEEVSQDSHLQAISCESGQGFLYSHPIPAPHVDEYLKSSAASTTSESSGNSEVLDRLLSGVVAQAEFQPAGV
jgi:predicted signal transduction protein with EAL and GGDEF domain